MLLTHTPLCSCEVEFKEFQSTYYMMWISKSGTKIFKLELINYQ